MRPAAYVTHRTPERLRLRIPARRGNEAFFAALRGALQDHARVAAVAVNPLTASALLLHEGVPPEELAHLGESTGLFDLVGGMPPGWTLPGRAAAALGDTDRMIAGLTRGGADVPGLLLVLLLIGAAAQLARGQVLAPATTFLWYAYDLLSRRYPAPPGDGGAGLD